MFQFTSNDEHIFLDVPFHMKDEAKSLFRGIKWHPNRRQWYCPNTASNVNILLNDREPDIRHEAPIAPDMLLPHQQLIFTDMIGFRRRIIGAEMRTGKTLSTLQAIKAVAEQTTGKVHWLWLAPKSGVISVEQEIVKWDLQMPENLTLHVYNYEKLANKWNPHLLMKYPELAYDGVVLDEGHRLKEPKSGRSRLAATMYEVMQHRAEGKGRDFFIWLLSGTPSPKDPSDWWHLCEIVHPGFLPWGSKEAMIEDLAFTKKTDYNGYLVLEIDNERGGWKKDKVAAFERDYVSRIATIVLKASVLSLPEKELQVIRLRTTGEQKSALAMVKNLAMDANVLTRKMQQISDGFVYTGNLDTKSDETLRTQINPKLDQLRKHLSEYRSDARLCVLAGFSESIDMLVDTCREEGWNVLRIDGRGYKLFPTTGHGWTDTSALAQMDQSRNPDRRHPLVVVGHPKSVATGLELSATKAQIYYSIVTDGEGMLQSMERAHSMNMRESLTIYFYFCMRSDELLYNAFQQKRDLLKLTMQELREAIDYDCSN